MPKNTSAGTTHERRSRRNVLSCTRVYGTRYLSSRSAISGGTRLATAMDLPFSGDLSFPVMRWSETVTSAILSWARSCSNSL